MSGASAALDWDYGALAAHYRHRAPYANGALADLFAMTGPGAGMTAADVGAGTGRLTAALVERRFDVIAIEPNAEMRAIGSALVPEARWLATRGEATGLADASCGLVTFGSSLNVLPATIALAEAARILRPGAWLACLWNHRDLGDPLQAALQAAIEREVPRYSHGSRREDPRPAITADGRFEPARTLEGAIIHDIACADFVDGFRAHATLVRQAGTRMPRVLAALSRVLDGRERIAVPFVTRVFVARRRT
jgi:SAM-dependent methyltransferase